MKGWLWGTAGGAEPPFTPTVTALTPCPARMGRAALVKPGMSLCTGYGLSRRRPVWQKILGQVDGLEIPGYKSTGGAPTTSQACCTSMVGQLQCTAAVWVSNQPLLSVGKTRQCRCCLHADASSAWEQPSTTRGRLWHTSESPAAQKGQDIPSIRASGPPCFSPFVWCNGLVTGVECILRLSPGGPAAICLATACCRLGPLVTNKSQQQLAFQRGGLTWLMVFLGGSPNRASSS